MFRPLKTCGWVLVIVLLLTGILVISFTMHGNDLVSVSAELRAAAGKDGPVYVTLDGGQARLEVGPDKPGKGVSHLAGGLDLHRGEEPNSPAEVMIDGTGAEIVLERAGGAPVLCVGEGVTLFLRNITFTGREDNNAPLIRVSGAGAKLVLEDGAVIRDNANGAANEAGGIVVGIGGRLEMTGGEIRGNRGTGRVSSGGVYAVGDFILTGGTISENRGIYGGGVGMNKSRFEMRGGTISGNDARYGGGGVYMDQSGFEMSGGTIRGNNAVNGGGVMARSAFEMNGGNISGNGALVMGGGVYATANFEMRGGTIEGNSSVIGGGVYTAVKGRIEKTGGGIIYGTGSLMGNTATGGSGHAVYAAGGGKMRNAGADTGDSLDSGTDAGWYL
jgi:hypothetical protein